MVIQSDVVMGYREKKWVEKRENNCNKTMRLILCPSHVLIGLLDMIASG